MRRSSYRLTVRGYELDSFGHVNNSVYLQYAETALWNFFKVHGLLAVIVEEGLFPVVILKGFSVTEGDGRGEFRRVDRAAAADADHGIRFRLPGQARGLDDARELRVLLYAAKHRDDAAVLLLHLLRRRGKVLSAGDHTALQAELTQDFAELLKLSLAEINLDRLGINKLMRHRCSPRSRPPWLRTYAYSLRASLPDPGTSRLRGRS